MRRRKQVNGCNRFDSDTSYAAVIVDLFTGWTSVFNVGVLSFESIGTIERQQHQEAIALEKCVERAENERTRMAAERGRE